MNITRVFICLGILLMNHTVVVAQLEEVTKSVDMDAWKATFKQLQEQFVDEDAILDCNNSTQCAFNMSESLHDQVIQWAYKVLRPEHDPSMEEEECDQHNRTQAMVLFQYELEADDLLKAFQELNDGFSGKAEEKELHLHYGLQVVSRIPNLGEFNLDNETLMELGRDELKRHNMQVKRHDTLVKEIRQEIAQIVAVSLIGVLIAHFCFEIPWLYYGIVALLYCLTYELSMYAAILPNLAGLTFCGEVASFSYSMTRKGCAWSWAFLKRQKQKLY